jgi:hypothetical protein
MIKKYNAYNDSYEKYLEPCSHRVHHTALTKLCHALRIQAQNGDFNTPSGCLPPYANKIVVLTCLCPSAAKLLTNLIWVAATIL